MICYTPRHSVLVIHTEVESHHDIVDVIKEVEVVMLSKRSSRVHVVVYLVVGGVKRWPLFFSAILRYLLAILKRK